MKARRNYGARRTSRDRGYILLGLLLVLATMAIVAGVAASNLAFSLRRDREQELIHRGVQYTRAIRTFMTKTGRYPNSLDELVKTRYLRRRYKDPLTNKDFRVLSVYEVMRMIGGGSAPAGVSAAGGTAAFSPVAPSYNALGANPRAQSTGATSGVSNATADNPSSSAGSDQQNTDSQNSDSQDKQVIGAQIAGVVSTSKDRTIREFDHKNHYSDWLFFFHPSFDRGFLINGPTPWTLKPSLTNVGNSLGNQSAQFQTPEQQSSPPSSPSQ